MGHAERKKPRQEGIRNEHKEGKKFVKLAVGRFQVMATLQAARAYSLGLPLESAYSWGLNRAIFYAAAKRGFKGGGATGQREGKPAGDFYMLGDEMAYKKEVDGKIYFTIGGALQTEQDFSKQVESRFSGSFPKIWEEALKIVNEYDKEALLSGKTFFARIYKPRRDELVKKWTEETQKLAGRNKNEGGRKS